MKVYIDKKNAHKYLYISTLGKAKEWYTKAAEQGNENAKEMLKKLN